ncbi:MAG: PA2778 family cysteine peptidase [Rhodoferax sp.]|uniref:PA2778 family cysteine peptidase n=1 Tax=Rhodoferax sp. TaxID=50421 RepID=UPI00260EFF7A|nr:PA2778 family cysteine peptidase [Rhodoferax sp.]MDD5336125.1 PA2778 family cysteine peptidase [Rhodoferax sp.]
MARLDAQWPADLAARVELGKVPFYPQEDYECGPAALAMAAAAAGVQVTPQALVEQVYLPGRKGSLQQEMLAATRRQGLLAYPLNPNIEAVLREVAAGHPVLVFQNLAFSFYPVWHYAVVIGFDRERNLLLLHSGRTERMEMSLFTFERTWARAQYWSMLALAPGRLPATAEAQTFAAAASALERVNPAAAQSAYAAALQRWPDDHAALLGAGNTAYALGQAAAAIGAYQAAVHEHPDFADAWNNLAQVLLEQGRRDEAAQAIGKAVVLGGARLPQYQELARLINETSATVPGK